MTAYLNRIDEPGDRGTIEFYAELIARQSNGNAQVTNPIAAAKAIPMGIASVEEQEAVWTPPQTIRRNITMNDESLEILTSRIATMSPTNWMLGLIAFILFLMLVLK